MKDKILANIEAQYLTIGNAIKHKDLYFRMSITSKCNDDCPYCHNEGMNGESIINFNDALKAIELAKLVGFNRIQFTGGEPLLNKALIDYIAYAHEFFDDVGITTNGRLLHNYTNDLSKVKPTRIHVSISESFLSKHSKYQDYKYSKLFSSLYKLRDKIPIIKINIPIVNTSSIGAVEWVLNNLHDLFDEVRILTIIPYANNFDIPDDYDIHDLFSNVKEDVLLDKITKREYRIPKGIRCRMCNHLNKCKELSRSLRLGSDNIFRPCLSTSDWDIPLNRDDMYKSIEDATIYALDY